MAVFAVTMPVMTLRFILLLIALCPDFLLAQHRKVTQAQIDSLDALRIGYIAAYQQMARDEMQRSGVPASITLAQGILESAAGTSKLARTANNHFGLKCGAHWNGAAKYKHDDEFDKKGRPVESCFRAYATVADNFADHSDFLHYPTKYHRYAPLFRLRPTDYRSWASGLQTVGYAPAGHYAARLVEFIERYRLDELDREAWSAPTPPRQRICQNNGVKCVYARTGETLSTIARQQGLNIEQLAAYNDRLYNASTPLPGGAIIYLASKRSNWQGEETHHFAAEVISLIEIAQIYGIQVAELRLLNKVDPGQEPEHLARVRLRGPADPGERMRYRLAKEPFPKPVTPVFPAVKVSRAAFPLSPEHQEALAQALDGRVPDFPSPVLAETTAGADSTAVLVMPDEPADDPASTADEAVEYTEHTFHQVGSGDTLRRLARQYEVSVIYIKRINQLKGDTIKVGQLLRVR
jgi:LysM repeat protein